MNNDSRVIQLTQGFVTVVDEQDFEYLNQWKWFYLHGYASRQIEGKNTKLHQIILPAPQGFVVDHLNRDKLDNRRSNLRLCTQQQNSYNRGVYNKKGATASRYKGICYCSNSARMKRWSAYIYVEKKRITLGYYYEEEDAALAYDAAARFYHKEFAVTNFEGTECLDAIEIRRRARS